MWVKLDDRFWFHDKLGELSLEALGLHMLALSFSGHAEKDGLLTQADLKRLAAPHPGDAAGAIEDLIDAGLWDRSGEEIRIHDFLTYNPSKNELDEKRDKDRRRKGGKPIQQDSARNPRGTEPESKAPEPEPDPTTKDPLQPVTTKANAPKNGRDSQTELGSVINHVATKLVDANGQDLADAIQRCAQAGHTPTAIRAEALRTTGAKRPGPAAIGRLHQLAKRPPEAKHPMAYANGENVVEHDPELQEASLDHLRKLKEARNTA